MFHLEIHSPKGGAVELHAKARRHTVLYGVLMVNLRIRLRCVTHGKKHYYMVLVLTVHTMSFILNVAFFVYISQGGSPHSYGWCMVLSSVHKWTLSCWRGQTGSIVVFKVWPPTLFTCEWQAQYTVQSYHCQTESIMGRKWPPGFLTPFYPVVPWFSALID